MAIQFVKVIFPTKRTVNVDHLELGETGEVLPMDAGHRIFDLGTPLDYTPGSQTIRVGGTTKSTPKLVVFTPVAAGSAIEPGTLPAPRPKMAKRVGAGKPTASAKKAAKKTSTKSAKKATKSSAKKAAGKSGRKAAKSPGKIKS